MGAPVHYSCARPDYIGHGGDMSHGCRISNEFMRIHGGYSWSLHRTSETHFSLSPRVASIYCAFLLALLARAERPTDNTHCFALMDLCGRPSPSPTIRVYHCSRPIVAYNYIPVLASWLPYSVVVCINGRLGRDGNSHNIIHRTLFWVKSQQE
jgi:hypothetical protein